MTGRHCRPVRQRLNLTTLIAHRYQIPLRVGHAFRPADRRAFPAIATDPVRAPAGTGKEKPQTVCGLGMSRLIPPAPPSHLDSAEVRECDSTGRSSGSRIALITAPSQGLTPVASCGFRPRLQRRAHSCFPQDSRLFPIKGTRRVSHEYCSTRLRRTRSSQNTCGRIS